jgi:hypothetical protein
MPINAIIQLYSQLYSFEVPDNLPNSYCSCRIYGAGINRSACTKRSYTVGGGREAYDPARDRKSTEEESEQSNLLNLFYLAMEKRQYL